MAKTKNSMKKILLKRQISNLEYRKIVSESYLPIHESILENRRHKKIEKLKSKLDNDLVSYEIDQLSNQDYQKYYTEKIIHKIDQDAYWKRRAIVQKYKRLSEHHQDESLDLNKADELTKLEEKVLEKKNTILSSYERKLDDRTISVNQKSYQEKMKEAETKLDLFKKGLIEADLSQMNKIQEKTKVKSQILQKQLEKKYEELNQIVTTSYHGQEVMKEDSILRLENLCMQFGGLKAVDMLDFEVKKGEIFGLIGPNGAGKTTVFNCITQFYKPNSGNIYYKDSTNEIIHLNEVKVHDVIKHGIVRTFQNVELIWELSVLDNMLVGAHSLYKTGFFAHSFQTMKYRHEETILKVKARKILDDLGLLGYQYFFPIGLPYGILKKIELARTLMTNPSLIILDEPAAGLNDAETEALAETIKKIQKDYNCTIFLVEHDMGLVMNICDTICAISFGKKLAIGTPGQIQKDPVVQQAYLGGE